MLKSLVVLNGRNRIPTLAESFWRWLGYLISILPLGLGFLTAVKQENYLTWHDKLAGTRVLCFEND
jgi:hypothetical protein